MSKASRQELEQQMAAFLSSGGKVTQVSQVDSPEMCEARYYNATDKMITRKFRKNRSRITKTKMALMQSSRGGTML